jgi:hypothetical protein
MKRYGYEFYLEWFATGVLLTGITLTSFNVYPLNLYVSMAGNALWFWLGIVWDKKSLLISQAIVVCLYLSGIYKYFTGV